MRQICLLSQLAPIVGKRVNYTLKTTVTLHSTHKKIAAAVTHGSKGKNVDLAKISRWDASFSGMHQRGQQSGEHTPSKVPLSTLETHTHARDILRRLILTGIVCCQLCVSTPRMTSPGRRQSSVSSALVSVDLFMQMATNSSLDRVYYLWPEWNVQMNIGKKAALKALSCQSEHCAHP